MNITLCSNRKAKLTDPTLCTSTTITARDPGFLFSNGMRISYSGVPNSYAVPAYMRFVNPESVLKMKFLRLTYTKKTDDSRRALKSSKHDRDPPILSEMRYRFVP